MTEEKINEKELFNEAIKNIRSLNLKDSGKSFLNFNYDCISLSKSFLYYYDKITSKGITLDSFNEINITKLRRLVEDYENAIRRKPSVRWNITRLIEKNKALIVFFVSAIENSDEEEFMEDLNKYLEKDESNKTDSK